MIKIVALNEESDETSGSEEEEVTREALEQIALAQYSKALELQRRGGQSTHDALKLLKDLLDTELLYDVKRPENGEKGVEPLYNLKYLCHKNIAGILSHIGQKEEAIEAYCEAAALDDTDVSLWFRLGCLCLECEKFDMALDAFQRGTNCNPKHWPCLDKIITLLLGLGHYNDCIVAIVDALKLDPSYLRGLAYRKHIYTEHSYVHDYMSYLNPEYSWKSGQDEIDEKRAEILLKEATDISEIYAKQIRESNLKYTLPELKLQKPITSLTWTNVGESLVHMHHYMTENCYTHASKLEIVFKNEVVEEKLDLGDQPECCKLISEEIMEVDKSENVSEYDNNVAEKPSPDKAEGEIDKADSDPDDCQEISENKIDNKEQKKPTVRRRGSALSFLEQWEWCTKRRSSRKKPQTKQDRNDENIYDTLRRLIPISLTPDVVQKKQDKPERLDDSPDTMDLYRLFEEKQTIGNNDSKTTENVNYFGSDLEKHEVSNFLNKFKNGNMDIIEILRDYLIILSNKWTHKWPKELLSVFVQANKCFSSHTDIPSYTEENYDEVKFFVLVNLMAEEINMNQKLVTDSDKKETVDFGIIESIGVLINKPHLFGDQCMNIALRFMWLKCHCYLYCKNDEFALDSLYQLLCEFEAMGEHEDTFTLRNLNFTFKPTINKTETNAIIKSLERNKRLSTVMSLYDMDHWEEVLSVILDSFEYCKMTAQKQEHDEISLDFAVQLSLILECYWGLQKLEECFKWSVICLHESLKHYLLCTMGSQEYEKWSLVVIKALECICHCLNIEGILFIDLLSEKELSQAIQDVIQVIGHQVDDNNGNEMPISTVTPWIILYFILQREEDQGRIQKLAEGDMCTQLNDEIPNALMVLFVGHEYLGKKSWCLSADGKLLYFILDTVIPRLRTPSLSKCVESVCQHLEQCVFCLFGHPNKKTRLRYLIDHNVTQHKLDWPRAQQLYEIFKPADLPEIEGKFPCISSDTEQLLQRIISLMPSDCDPQKYLPEIVKYIDLKIDTLPNLPFLLPFKMKDLYFILGDYYFKKDERSKSMKYNLYDILINNNRFESWAEIALAKATNLEVKLNSSANIKDMDYIKEGSSAIRCFKQALELDSKHCNLWIEYGVFVYGLHSFCSRLLKQASESLSMEDFEALEQRKEEMLDTAHKCFTTVSQDLNNSDVPEDENDELWLHCYMLGKVAEKKNKSPKEYLDHYMQAAKHLEDNNATYPSKINYNTPQHLSIEALEVHYRIHASILKYIEQHENKTIFSPDGKVFQDCLEKCANGPFSTNRKSKKDNSDENESSTSKQPDTQPSQSPITTLQASSILKRSISDSGDDIGVEAKKQKIETACKVRRAASYDADCQIVKNSLEPQDSAKDVFKAAIIHNQDDIISESDKTKDGNDKIEQTTNKIVLDSASSDKGEANAIISDKDSITKKVSASDSKKELLVETTSNSDSSSSSSSDSSSDDSSSDTSSSSGTDTTNKSNSNVKPLSETEILQIISVCLDALEDCVSRFPQHYKALYRLAHYHFYYKKGKDVERCRDLMLANFVSRNNQKLPGLFCERKNNNFFNAIWRIPATEVDRAGSFACHMSRCVLLTMEILKEIDDHKTLLDLSMQLSKIPEPDKKYLRETEREELAQQAFSLCVQSLKGQVTKFSHQPDLKTNELERQALNSLMLDIYRAYQKVQKQPTSKQFTNLLIEAFKLITLTPISENANLVDLSMKHCQALIASLKQQATLASMNNINAKKNLSKSYESAKVQQGQVTQFIAKPDSKVTLPTPTLPIMSAKDMSVAFQNYLPMIKETLMSQQTAAALSLSYLSSSIGYPTLQNPTPPVSSLQTEYYNKILTSLAGSYALPKKGSGNRSTKNYNKPGTSGKIQKSSNTSKILTGPIPTSVIKCVEMPTISTSNIVTSANMKVSSSLPVTNTATTTVSTISKSLSAPSTSSFSMSQMIPSSLSASMSSYGTSVQPAHMSSIAPTSFTTPSTGTAKPAHMTSTSTVNAAIHTKPPLPHQQVSPGKTLQEKLAERQKNLPVITKGNTIMTQELISSSISKLPSSLTVTKTSVIKQNTLNITEAPKNPEVRRLQFDGENNSAPKNTMPSEVIVLDDDS